MNTLVAWLVLEVSLLCLRLAEVLIVINNKRKIEAVQQSAVLADMECSTKVLMPEKVVVDTSAVDELIQKFKNGLEVS